MEPKKPFHEVVAEKLIEQLKAGTAPWQKPWEPGQPNAYLPFNPTTGKRYKGINAIHLMAQDRSDGRWMTYKQADAVGAQVRKGEKGTPVQYWKFSEEQDKLDENGRPVLDEKGKPVKETVMLERPRVFFATVFNAEQIDGLPLLQPLKEQTWNAVERAEHILKASGAKITHAPGDRAFYRPSTDSITLPERGQFTNSDRYYATALHELGHWTGHPSRLDRDLAHPFGSQGYAKEELRAEIASMILGDELGIGHDPGQHAAYVGFWIKALQDEPLEVFRAAADAEKIHDYVMAFEQKQVQDQDQQQVEDQRPPHEMTLAEFITQAKTEELTSHGRKWSVTLGDRYAAFSDADSPQAALADVHWAAVNNALFLNTPEAAGISRKPTLPPPAVLAEYPDLVAQYPQATEQENKMQTLDAKADQASGRNYINVPFKEKNEAKQLGARWDRQQQSWYVPPGVDTAPFTKWAQTQSTNQEAQRETQKPAQQTQQARQYLAVSYEQRNAAKAAGALWDKAAKSWYVGPRADAAKLERWKPENVQAQQGPAMTPREEFAEAMRSAGLFTGSNAQGDHPIMDGMRHRVPVEGGKKGALDGFYVGHLDGHPAGRIINNKTGVDITWKSKGYALSDQEKAKLQAEAAEKLAQRAVEQERAQEATAQRVGQQMANLVPIEQPTPYLKAKGIQAHAGVMTDREGQKTYVPAFDAEGKQWTMQYIQEDGTKRFAKDSKKEACFHPVGGMDALAAAPALVISEGYATAAQVAEAVGHATVAAFDSGNLEAVAKALHAKFPDKPIIIAGDDDRHLIMTHGNNPGREKADAAALAVGGKSIFPIFAPAENNYPRDLPAITPDSFKAHLRAEQRLADAAAGKVELAGDEATKLKASMLSGAQIAALSTMKQYTDFNDLAHKSELGIEGVKRQIGAAVSQVKREEQQHREQKHIEKKQQRIEQRPRRAARIG